MDLAGTRESLLDAAEALFSANGIQASSLRAITQRASANLAAVHYHFGSKEGLVRAVFSRRLAPLNDERLRLLDEAEADPAGGVERVLCAFIAPLLRMAPAGAAGFTLLMGRAFMEPSEEVRAILAAELEQTIHRFTGALRRRLPHLPEEEVLWRFHFVAGSMGHTVACGQLLERYSGGRCRVGDAEEAIDRLVTFLAAGLRAPATEDPAAVLEKTLNVAGPLARPATAGEEQERER